MPLTIRLHKGDKALQEKAPMLLNDVIDLSRQRSSDLKHKRYLVSLQVQTAHFGIGANAKQAGTSFREKKAQNLDRINKNPLAAIITLLIIYREVIHSVINKIPISS